MSQQNPWRTKSSRVIYKNPWITVREDQVVRPDGNDGIYSVVETRIATGVVALTEKEEIYLVGQYRYPTSRYSWEIIEGGTDKNELPLNAAQRELAEEAGLIAAKWVPLLENIELSNCHSSELGCLYLATELSETAKAPEGTEVLETICIPFEKALQMVRGGEILDAFSIIGILHAADRLGYK